MKQYTYPKLKRLTLSIATIITLSYGIANFLSLLEVIKEETPLIIYFRMFVMMFASLQTSFYLIKSIFSVIKLDDTNFKRYSFSKLKQTQDYKDVKDIGVGYVITPLGKRKRLYFSKKVLTNNEINNLGLVSDECIYFSYLSNDSYNLINDKLEINLDIKQWIQK